MGVRELLLGLVLVWLAAKVAGEGMEWIGQTAVLGELLAGVIIREDAVPERGPRAEGDQREHVQAAHHHRLPAADEEGPAAPEHHRRREDELDPQARRHAQPPDQLRHRHAAHLEAQERHRERHADPEAPGHVGQLGVRLFLRDRLERLQRHAALGTAPGPDPADLGMHRAGIDTPVDSRRLRRLLAGRRGHRRDVLRGVGHELVPARGAAEPVRRLRVLGAAATGLAGRHVHAADRVLHGRV